MRLGVGRGLGDGALSMDRLEEDIVRSMVAA